MVESGAKTAAAAAKAVLADASIPHKLGPAKRGSEADCEVSFPSSGARLFLDYHPWLAPAQVGGILEHLKRQAAPGSYLGIVVRRLSESLLDACKEKGVAAFDLDGNAWLRLPGVYLERWRPVRAETKGSSGTVFTAKASRLIRAFLHRYPHDWTQARLVRETGLSRGYVSRLVARMIADGYVSNRLDLLYLDEPDSLLDDWLAHYRFSRHVRAGYAVSMNSYDDGLAKVGDALKKAGVEYAFTGWSGAHLRAPYAVPPSVMAYVEKLPGTLDTIFPVEGESNVLLLLPHDMGVFQFASRSGYGPVVSDAQLYLDLCRMPGRAKEQADALRRSRLSFARRKA